MWHLDQNDLVFTWCVFFFGQRRRQDEGHHQGSSWSPCSWFYFWQAAVMFADCSSGAWPIHHVWKLAIRTQSESVYNLLLSFRLCLYHCACLKKRKIILINVTFWREQGRGPHVLKHCFLILNRCLKGYDTCIFGYLLRVQVPSIHENGIAS